MSRSEKRRTGKRPPEKAPVEKPPKGRFTGFIIALVVIAVVGAIVGVFYYQEYAAPFHRTIITVDSTTIDMDYFLRRSQLEGLSAMSMLSILTDEQIIKLEAPQYVDEISPEDISQALKGMVSGENKTISDSELKEWYRQQLNETRLSDAEFKEYIRTNLLASRLQAYLAERVPTIAEQVHVHAILLENYEDAEKVRKRWEKGEKFADLAMEVSIDEPSKETGGDLGWVPRGILNPSADYVAFNLSVDNISDPVPFNPNPTGDPSQPETTYYLLLMVSEKTAARELVGEPLQAVKNSALEKWLSEERGNHEIKYNFDSETSAWINWQLAKLAKARGDQQGS